MALTTEVLPLQGGPVTSKGGTGTPSVDCGGGGGGVHVVERVLDEGATKPNYVGDERKEVS